MNFYYFESLKQALSSGNLSQEGLKALIDETGLFLGILRVKLESKNPDIREQAAQELRKLKLLLLENSKK